MVKNAAKLLWILALGGLAASCTPQDLGHQFKEVSEVESKIQFYGPGLEGGYRQFLTAAPTLTSGRKTVASYGAKQGEFPLAFVAYNEAPPEFKYEFLPSITKVISSMDYFKNRKIVRGEFGFKKNPIGDVEYLPFTADGISCVSWVQAVGQVAFHQVGTALIYGYYCKGEGPVMSEKEANSIVNLLGHVDHGWIEPPN